MSLDLPDYRQTVYVMRSVDRRYHSVVDHLLVLLLSKRSFIPVFIAHAEFSS